MTFERPTNAPLEATTALRQNFDAWLERFESEFRSQATKVNAASNTRMRRLLRDFSKEVYVPYRDSTLGKGE